MANRDEDARADLAVQLAEQHIKSHIKQLQQYNDVRDIATQLMGLIADKRGVRFIEVQQEFGVAADD